MDSLEVKKIQLLRAALSTYRILPNSSLLERVILGVTGTKNIALFIYVQGCHKYGCYPEKKAIMLPLFYETKAASYFRVKGLSRHLYFS